MKKLMIVIGLICGSFSLSHAFGRYGGESVEVWRSSTTSSIDTNIMIASGSIVFHGVVISSGNTGAQISIYDNSAFIAGMSSGPVIDADLSRVMTYDILLSSGLMYSTIGSASATILWEWVVKPNDGRRGANQQ